MFRSNLSIFNIFFVLHGPPQHLGQRGEGAATGIWVRPRGVTTLQDAVPWGVRDVVDGVRTPDVEPEPQLCGVPEDTSGVTTVWQTAGTHICHKQTNTTKTVSDTLQNIQFTDLENITANWRGKQNWKIQHYVHFDLCILLLRKSLTSVP